MYLLMYVDDDPDDHQIFAEALNSINPHAKCLMARDGREALQMLNELQVVPEYIFLDLNMPQLDGKAFLREIRSSDRLKDIQVIVYSTSKNPRDAEECARLGAVDFIVKPSTLREIYDNVNKFVLMGGSSRCNA